MPVARRLSEVFKSSIEVLFDDASKIILFSDCHRGDNSWADDFADNQNTFFHALSHYFDNGYMYIEIGDGDELWEDAYFDDIRNAHDNIFWLMSEFHKEKRLYLIWGNHNRKWKDPRNVERYLYHYYDEIEKKVKPLFEGITVHEGVVLRHQETGKRLFLAHGHQGDLLNDQLWWFGRFVVRNFWKSVQLLGVKDPTRPAKNFKKRTAIEKEIVEWSKSKRQAVVVGHTHRPSFPGDTMPPYFNTGSCVHPRCITGIEIDKGSIALIKWFVDVKSDKEKDGCLFINKKVLVGPRKLQDVLT
jgi:UDP-2,3-diacylglucosamine pyrophosphatase LpxH